VESLVTEELRKVFAGKKVLITGHTGFKGSWLCTWLAKLGADVVGYALDPRSDHDNFVVSKVGRNLHHIAADIRRYDGLKRAFNQCKPEFVFHLAAQAIVLESYANPKETYDTNVGGAINMLECCRNSESVRVIVNVTSDKCYDNRNWVWGYRENDPMGGYDPYSSSKACSELVTGAYRDSFFKCGNGALHSKSLSSARAGNVIGGGDWSKFRIIPDSIRSLIQGQPIRVRNPHAVRPWQYVLEPLSGYLLLAARMYANPGAYEGAWNFGPNHDSCIAVRTLVEHVLKHWGGGHYEEFPGGDGLREEGLLTLDTAKSRTKLGWRSVVDFADAVKLTVDWYKAFEAKADMAQVCARQIEEYMERMDESY
jgi:CDP-glucose 4,6-dehydratase